MYLNEICLVRKANKKKFVTYVWQNLCLGLFKIRTLVLWIPNHQFRNSTRLSFKRKKIKEESATILILLFVYISWKILNCGYWSSRKCDGLLLKEAIPLCTYNHLLNYAVVTQHIKQLHYYNWLHSATCFGLCPAIIRLTRNIVN